MDILANNMLVLIIYAFSGVLVRTITGSKLSTLVPWCIFSIHLLQTGRQLYQYIVQAGVYSGLAYTLPHAWLEIPGLVLACIAGSRLCRGKKALLPLSGAATFITLGAVVEVFVTPFPFLAM